MMADVFARPLPRLQGYTAEFYAWTKQRELRFQRCTGCGRWRHVPRSVCAGCGSTAWEWARSAGKGCVYTFSITHRPMHPAFLATPYATVVVELDEGPRVMTWLRDVPPEDVRIGLRVEVVFEDVSDDVTLPMFRPSR
jgi:uncharacterized OB-fold protein